jgi:septal ring factor EnvC (AmiA/AmiB activator)
MNDALWTYADLIGRSRRNLVETQWKLDDARRDHARLTAEIPRLEEQVERERRYIAEYVHSIIKEGTNRPAPKCPVEARQ